MTRIPSAHESAVAIRDGQISSEALVQEYLETIQAREPVAKAFEYLNPEIALAEARRRDQQSPRSPLHGIPIAIKDIIDTADMPTGYGSSIYAGHQPLRDAACVALCRAAGMVILGKTVTTEFAYLSPGKTTNPHNIAHTPGGSSSGSAAAVATAMAPLALGTQTAGSVIRPAAFCGTLGYKPSHGCFSLEGVLGLSPSLDTLGVFSTSVADLSLMRQVLLCAEESLPPSTGTAPHLGLLLPRQQAAEAPALEMIDQVCEKLRQAGAVITPLSLGNTFDVLVEAQQLVMTWEAARSRAHEYFNHREGLSEAFLALVEQGMAISHRHYRLARSTLAATREEIRRAFALVDCLLTLPAPGEAPRGLQSTGDPLFNRIWTLLGTPCITLPAGTGPAKLPLGVQLVGAVGQDQSLLNVAAWVEQQLAAGICLNVSVG